MIGEKIATTFEVLTVTIGMIALASLGAFVTPKVGVTTGNQVLETRSERVIAEARGGYDIDTCVRDISPRTVLSESDSGMPELIVLEGAPVTECFPELAQFMEPEEEQGKTEGGIVPIKEDRGTFGADMKTSVMVLPPNASTIATSTEERAEAKAPTSTPAVLAPSEVNDPLPVIPSGGSTRESTLDSGVLPPLDRFEACRISMFGQSVPATLSDEETSSFEACLSAEFPPTLGE